MENVVNMRDWYPNDCEYWWNDDGTSVSEPQVTITIDVSFWIQCPRCGAWIWPQFGYNFCPYCGTDLNMEYINKINNELKEHFAKIYDELMKIRRQLGIDS